MKRWILKSVLINNHCYLAYNNVAILAITDIYRYLENSLPWQTKIAARVLIYELGSPSYGDSKFKKLINLKKTIILQYFMANGFFQMR